MTRRDDLTTPRQRRAFGVHYDPEAFGRFSESIARTLGTARFLVIQTVIVFLWISLNVGVGRAALGQVPVHPAQPGVLARRPRTPRR